MTENERQFIQLLIRLKKAKRQNKQKRHVQGRPPKMYEITDPFGNKTIINNLNKFCKERGLNQSNIIYYPNGHKKWKARHVTEQEHAPKD
jgi:hypothetical protein